MKIFSFNDHGIAVGVKFTAKIIENLKSLFEIETVSVKHISFVYCTDNYLLKLNQKYLSHNTLTDVITFTLSEAKAPIESEIYISVERVRENAKVLNTKYRNELLRVMIHGMLHLCGYNDKTSKQKSIMREKEDYYLSFLGST